MYLYKARVCISLFPYIRGLCGSIRVLKNLQFTAHQKCASFGLISLISTNILWKSKKTSTIKLFKHLTTGIVTYLLA